MLLGAKEAFRTVPGVVSTRVGYAGGHAPDPTCRDVCSGVDGTGEEYHQRYFEKRRSASFAG
ncbi:MAG TPA: peptide-methionine (S)-S-oxide reductase [Thermoleophilaceae bacterium]|nr:peptide-methionine (S)-S-oxide reductase [Thermoleophilaceae bacterium]